MYLTDASMDSPLSRIIRMPQELIVQISMNTYAVKISLL